MQTQPVQNVYRDLGNLGEIAWQVRSRRDLGGICIVAEISTRSLRDLREISEISPRLQRSRRDRVNFDEISARFVLFLRSRRDLAEMETFGRDKEISPRTLRDL